MDVSELGDLLQFARDVRAYFVAHGQLEGAAEFRAAAQRAISEIGRLGQALADAEPSLAEAVAGRRDEIAAAMAALPRREDHHVQP